MKESNQTHELENI